MAIHEPSQTYLWQLANTSGGAGCEIVTDTEAHIGDYRVIQIASTDVVFTSITSTLVTNSSEASSLTSLPIGFTILSPCTSVQVDSGNIILYKEV